jgi:hypothetical protein
VAADIITRLRRAGSTFFGTLWRIARQLFHETAGALFAVFAVAGALAAWREWQRGERTWLLWLALAFVVMMGSFAVAAFRSARRVR